MNFFKKLFLKRCVIDSPTIIKPKNFSEKYYYKVTGECDNCLATLSLFIQKGLYVKYEISNIICPNCGCKVDRGNNK